MADGRMNNVDVRYNFPLGGQAVALVTATNRSNDSIAVYRVDPSTRQLENVAAGTLFTGITVYGTCMYHSPVSGRYYVYVNSKAGVVEQWELFDNGSGQVEAVMVRSFDVGSQTEGCVADDELTDFYIGEEDVGIWKYGAEPGDGTARTQVDTTGAGGHLTADVEGLTLYYASDGTGYLIASSQGSDEYVVYEREGNNAHVMTFAIVAGNGIDAMTGTDGIAVTNVPLGPAFPQGVFVAHDTSNNGGENYKLVPWQTIANFVSPALTIDTTWDPRQDDTPPPPPPGNQAPVANNDSVTTDPEVALIIDVLANDTDADTGDTLTVSAVTPPTNGSVVNNNIDVTYTPNTGFSGTDTFSYIATDGTSASNSATVTVTVTAAPPPPGAKAGDSDGDGMADEWELAFAFDPSDGTDAGQDADGDGFSNLEEFQAGTDPHDATDNTPPLQAVLRGPYLQQGTPTSVIVKWRTAHPTTSGIYYGTTAEALTADTASDTLTTEHELLISNLQPDTRYYYKVGNFYRALVSNESAYSFSTAPTPSPLSNSLVMIASCRKNSPELRSNLPFILYFQLGSMTFPEKLSCVRRFSKPQRESSPSVEPSV